MVHVYSLPATPCGHVQRLQGRVGVCAATAMAVYANLDEFKHGIKTATSAKREQFLHSVKHSHIHDTYPYPDTDTMRALLFAQQFKMVPQAYGCPKCGAGYDLRWKKHKCIWCGPRYSGGCPECNGKETAVSCTGFFRDTHMSNWMTKLDCLIMWIIDYARSTILLETNPGSHQLVDKWVSQFQKKVRTVGRCPVAFGVGLCFLVPIPCLEARHEIPQRPQEAHMCTDNQTEGKGQGTFQAANQLCTTRPSGESFQCEASHPRCR